jgi:CelD/BcsL family acetyltransferase involved in cellulose biosynthesis
MGQADIIHARTSFADTRASAPAGTGIERTGTAGYAIRLSVHTDLAAVEQDWRAFEQTADCTAFQTFDWLETWQRCVGTLTGTTPAIVIARNGDHILFILPLAVEPRGFVRRLTFLGHDLCDYNAPLLAPKFSAVVGPNGFGPIWREIRALLRATPALGHDVIVIEKMPERIGAQANPLMSLGVRLNPSGAYETALSGDWEEFYTAKRSSATRRRDRTKLKRLGEMGAVKFVRPEEASDVTSSLDVLIVQKSKAFARMGIANMFARPGYTAFYHALASQPRLRSLIHLSRLDVGETWAALNLGLTFRDCYYHILASYDDGEVSRFGPGAAHLRELLRYAIEQGLKRFDFTIGDESYKRDWCETEQHLHDFSAAVTLRGWPSVALSVGWRRLKRTIKQSERLWNAAQRVRSMVAGTRQKPAPAAKEPSE